jgi:hypothetical protein
MCPGTFKGYLFGPLEGFIQLQSYPGISPQDAVLDYYVVVTMENPVFR